MNSNTKGYIISHKDSLLTVVSRITALIVALFLLVFFASSSAFAGTSLPSTPPDREGYYEFLGIDVSEWQGNIDWKAVKSDGVNYAFIRAGATTSSNFDFKTDSKFDVNMEGAKAAGIARGVYWYSQATNEDEAIAEAKKLVALAKKYDLELPLVMDLEFSDGRFDNAYTSWRANGSEYAKKRMTAVADAFLSYCRSQGYPASIYLSTSLAGSTTGVDTTNLVNNSNEVWIAHYSSNLSASSDYTMWQFTSTGRVDGIKGKVDYDVMYVDKKAVKAGSPGLNAEASNDMLKYTGGPVTININLTDNGKSLSLNKDYTVSYINNINTGTAYALVKGKGDYIGYKEVIPFKIGDEDILNSTELEPSKVVTSVKDGKTSVKFTAASGRVDNYRIEYRNTDSDEWNSVMTDGKTEYVIDGTPKQIRVSSVLGKDIYGLALPDNSQKYEIIDGSVEADYKLSGQSLLNGDKFKKINEEVSGDVVI